MAAAGKPPTSLADFKALDATHQQIADHLNRLVSLMDHLDRDGLDARAQHEAKAIEAFFSSTSQQHHLDEETKVFPPLLASSDEALVANVKLLQQDHGWIEEDWLALAPQLRAIASGYNWVDPSELRHGVQVFVDLCREHIVLEESVVYPEAKAYAARLERRRATLPPLHFTAGGPSSS